MKQYMLSEAEVLQLVLGKLNINDVRDKEIIYAVTVSDIKEEAKKLGVAPKKAIASMKKKIIDAMPSLDEIITEDLWK